MQIKTNNITYYVYQESFIGHWLVLSDGENIIQVKPFASAEKSWILQPNLPILKECTKQLSAYFKGELQRFNLPLMTLGTDFQKSVWRQLCLVDYGQTCCYAEIARAIGRPKAARAVGQANHNNPISVIIPCHRVIGANGTLTGYANGLSVKQKLLDLESESC